LFAKLFSLLGYRCPLSLRPVLSGAQIRAGRALLGWSQAKLAKEAGLSEASIKDIEAEATDPRRSTLKAIEGTFEKAGVIFFDAGVNRDGGPGVRFKR
jgi:transcriptional regulator with XRE-family HTH domain